MNKENIEVPKCEKHDTLLSFEPSQPYLKNILDEDGNIIDTVETETGEMFYCPECENEAFQDNLYKAYTTGEGIDEIEKLVSRQSGTNGSNTMTSGYSLIDKFSVELMKHINIPKNIARATIMSLIGSQLSQAVFFDGIGAILPTLPVVWIGPPGTLKTPVTDGVITKVLYKLQDGSDHSYKRIFNSTTGPALMSSVSKLEKGQRHNVGVIIDEISKMGKMLSNSNTADIQEIFNEFIDGKVNGKNTKNSGDERGALVFPFLFMGGTPVFLRHINEDFWDVGLGSRLFFLRFEPVEPRAISPTYKAHSDFIDALAEELKDIRSIKEGKWDPEMWRAYNEYQMGIDEEINKVQLSVRSILTTDIFEITGKVKNKVKVLKLSIIYAAARKNFSKNGVLKIELEDFEKAKQDLEDYFHPNTMQIYRLSKEIDQDMGNLKNEQKVISAIKGLIKRGESYRLVKGKSTNKVQKWDSEEGRMITVEEDMYNAVKDPDGEWVLRYRVLQNISGKFRKYVGDDTFNSLLEQHLIHSKTATLTVKQPVGKAKISSHEYISLNTKEVERSSE